MDLGKRLKATRRSKGLTLQQIADAANLSKSFVSQIETGAAKPSIASLKKICDVLGTPLGALFASGAEQQPDGSAVAAEAPAADGGNEVRVVRKSRRKMLAWPGSAAMSYLLTPDLRRKLEVVLSETGPGDTTEHEPYTHTGEEFGLVLEGRYEVTVGDQVYVLEEGDSIYYPSHLPHRMRVLGEKPAKTLWVITPPSF